MAIEIWNVNAAHSEIAFKLRHLIVAEITGKVGRWSATVAFDPERLTRSSIEAVLEAGSMETDDPERDNHIRSKEFLNVEAFPKIRFKSQSVTPVDANRYLIAGALTIRDATREVILEVEDLGRNGDAKGAGKAKFRAHATVNRQHFGLHWNQDLDTGGVVLGDKVDIQIAVEATVKERAARPAVDHRRHAG